MAIRFAEEYLGKVEPPSDDYPHGAPRNESMPDANDGTPFEEAWLRDYEGFSQALLKEGGITPSGEPDTALASQRLEALKALLLPRAALPRSPGYLHSTGSGYEAQTAEQVAEAIDDLLPLAQLYLGKSTTDPATPITGSLLSGAMLAAGAIVEMGENANGSYWRWESGLQVCATYLPTGTWTYPARFETSRPFVFGTPIDGGALGMIASAGSSANPPTATSTTLTIRDTNPPAVRNDHSGNWLAIGFWK